MRGRLGDSGVALVAAVPTVAKVALNPPFGSMIKVPADKVGAGVAATLRG